MTSRTTEQFRERFAELPEDVQQQAQSKFSMWLENPRHPSLHFKKVSDTQPVWSVRVNRSYRALGIKEGDHSDWIWIGPHDESTNVFSRTCSALIALQPAAPSGLPLPET